MGKTAQRLDTALKSAGVPIVGVSIGNEADRTTWKASPLTLQPQAQPTIDVFDPAAAPVVDTELDGEIRDSLDNERLISAVVWAIIDQFLPPATITKYNTAGTKIIAAYKTQPWKP